MLVASKYEREEPGRIAFAFVGTMSHECESWTPLGLLLISPESLDINRVEERGWVWGPRGDKGWTITTIPPDN